MKTRSAGVTRLIILASMVALLLGCNSESERPEVDIQATVQSEVEKQLEIEATIQARVKEELDKIDPTATPVPPTATSTPTPVPPTPTFTPTPVPPIPTATLTPTPTPSKVELSPPVPSRSSVVDKALPGVMQVRTNKGSGSGFVYSYDEKTGRIEIITNEHVIDGSSWVQVKNDLGLSFNATVIGKDSTRDLALLSACCVIYSSQIEVLPLADSSQVKLASDVIAIGYPLGIETVSVTSGIVSRRYFDSASDQWIIQTNAAINPGNSGGPLLSMDGKVLGINTKILRNNKGVDIEGFGMAVASETLLQYIDQLQSSSTFTTPPSPTPIATAVAACTTATQCYEIGYAHYKNGEYTKALPYHTEGIRLDSSSWKNYWCRGASLINFRQYDEGIEDMNKATDISPLWPIPYAWRGLAYIKLSSWQQALDELNKAIDLGSTHYSTYANRGLSYKNLGQYQKAIDDYDEALRLEPGNQEVLDSREIALKLLGDISPSPTATPMPTLTWTFPGVYNPGHFVHTHQENANTQVFQDTNGGLNITYKQFGELGLTGGQGLTLIRDGVYPMFEIVPAYFAGDRPEMNLYYLLGLAFDMDQTYQVHNGTVGMRDDIYADYNASRLPVYGDFSFIPQALFTKKQIKTIDDLQGVVVRHYSTLGAEGLRSLGMNPVTIAWQDVYPALDQGVVDAAVTLLSSGTKAGFGEQTNYVTIIPQGGGLLDTVFNIDALESLPSDYHLAIEVAGRQSSNNIKAEWGLESYDDGPAELAYGAGLNYWKMDDSLTKEFKSRLGPYMDDWATASGPTARKWLYTALELLGR